LGCGHAQSELAGKSNLLAVAWMPYGERIRLRNYGFNPYAIFRRSKPSGQSHASKYVRCNFKHHKVGPGEGEMAAPIEKEDSNQERIAKLLPADLTAAFLSAKASLTTAYGDTANGTVFWTFVAILALCPFYFRFANKISNRIQIIFLAATFFVFALSIASKEFSAYLSSFQALARIGTTVDVAAIIVPILWVFVVSRIFLQAFGDKVEHVE
jgi:hypothetical protein